MNKNILIVIVIIAVISVSLFSYRTAYMPLPQPDNLSQQPPKTQPPQTSPSQEQLPQTPSQPSVKEFILGK